MASSSFPWLQQSCAVCTFQDCRHFKNRVDSTTLVCDKPGCPVLNRPSIFRSPWAWAFIAMIVFAISVLAAAQVEKMRREARRPQLISVSSDPVAWRGEKWEAFADGKGEGTLTYQWFTGFPGDVSNPLQDATESTLRIASVQKSERYWVRISSEYGTADSESIGADVRTRDVQDHRAELDELISFSRTMLEQMDSLREIDALFNSLVPLDQSEQRRFSDLHARSTSKAQEAAAMLVGKLKRLRSSANSEMINELLAKGRPAVLASDSLEGERQRKAYDIIEKLWRTVRDGHEISEKLTFELAATKLPL